MENTVTRIAQEPYCHITDQPPHEEDEIMNGHKRAYEAVTNGWFRLKTHSAPCKLLAEIELKAQLDGEDKHFMYFVLDVYGMLDGDDIIIDRVETTEHVDITDSINENEMRRIRQYIRENC